MKTKIARIILAILTTIAFIASIYGFVYYCNFVDKSAWWAFTTGVFLFLFCLGLFIWVVWQWLEIKEEIK